MLTIGELVQHFLTKLDWYSTLFPRIAVPIQKQIEVGLRQHKASQWKNNPAPEASGDQTDPRARAPVRGNDEVERPPERHPQEINQEKQAVDRPSAGQSSRHRTRSRSPRRSQSRDHHRSSRDRHSHSRRGSKDRHSHSRRSRDRRRSRSHSRHRCSPSDHHKSSSSRDHGHSRRDRQEGHRDRRRSLSPVGQEHSKPRDDHHTHHRSHESNHRQQERNGSEDEFKRDLRKEMERIKRNKGGKSSTEGTKN